MIRIRKPIIIFGLALIGAATLARGQAPATPTAPIIKQQVTFRSNDLALIGYLFKPEGAGPFPAVLWNHGSERAPDGPSNLTQWPRSLCGRATSSSLPCAGAMKVRKDHT